MAKSKKQLERELYGPSMTEVCLGATLSVMLGGMLAAAYLVVQPVEQVRSMPKEPDETKTYYVTGSARSSGGGQWLRKKQMLIEGGRTELTLNENELNTWMSSSEAKPEADEESPGMIEAESINFRVADGMLQIGIPCAINVAGFNQSVIIQAQGGFERGADQFVYVPERLLIGTLDVRRLPFVSDILIGRFMAAQEVPEELSNAWDSLDEVTIEGDVVKLARR